MQHTRITEQLAQSIKIIKYNKDYDHDDRLIQKIKDNINDNTLKIEKITIKGFVLWSLKLGYAERAIITVEDGTLYIHELLPEHNYLKSTVLNKPQKSKDTQNYVLLENNTKASTESTESQLHVTFEKEIRITDAGVIELDAMQEELVVEVTENILKDAGSGTVNLIEGQAGSGKTVAMLEILAMISQNEDVDDVAQKKQIKVLVKQKALRDNIKKNYQDHYANDKIDVEFVTYQEILEQNDLSNYTASLNEFQAWYAQLLDTNNKLNKDKQHKKSKSKNTLVKQNESKNISDKVYEDLQQIAAERYADISTGKKKLVSGIEKSKLEQIYAQYIARKDKKLLDPTLDIKDFVDQIKSWGDIDALFIDECYDFVAGEYVLIHKLLQKEDQTNAHLFAFGDMNQSLGGQYGGAEKNPIQDCLSVLCKTEVKHVTLVNSHRNPLVVQQILKNIFQASPAIFHNAKQIANRLEENIENKQDQADASAKYQYINNSASQEFLDIKDKITTTTSLAIIVPDATLKEVVSKQLGNKDDIYTIGEIKGLEFDDVILFNFFSYESGYLAKALSNPEKSKDAKYEMKQLYCALSRSCNNVTIVELHEVNPPSRTHDAKNTNNTSNITKVLSQVNHIISEDINTTKDGKSIISTFNLDKATARVRTLIEKKLYDMARNILQKFENQIEQQQKLKITKSDEVSALLEEEMHIMQQYQKDMKDTASKSSTDLKKMQCDFNNQKMAIVERCNNTNAELIVITSDIECIQMNSGILEQEITDAEDSDAPTTTTTTTSESSDEDNTLKKKEIDSNNSDTSSDDSSNNKTPEDTFQTPPQAVTNNVISNESDTKNAINDVLVAEIKHRKQIMADEKNEWKQINKNMIKYQDANGASRVLQPTKTTQNNQKEDSGIDLACKKFREEFDTLVDIHKKKLQYPQYNKQYKELICNIQRNKETYGQEFIDTIGKNLTFCTQLVELNLVADNKLMSSIYSESLITLLLAISATSRDINNKQSIYCLLQHNAEFLNSANEIWAQDQKRYDVKFFCNFIQSWVTCYDVDNNSPNDRQIPLITKILNDNLFNCANQISAEQVASLFLVKQPNPIKYKALMQYITECKTLGKIFSFDQLKHILLDAVIKCQSQYLQKVAYTFFKHLVENLSNLKEGDDMLISLVSDVTNIPDTYYHQFMLYCIEKKYYATNSIQQYCNLLLKALDNNSVHNLTSRYDGILKYLSDTDVMNSINIKDMPLLLRYYVDNKSDAENNTDALSSKAIYFLKHGKCDQTVVQVFKEMIMSNHQADQQTIAKWLLMGEKHPISKELYDTLNDLFMNQSKNVELKQALIHYVYNNCYKFTQDMCKFIVEQAYAEDDEMYEYTLYASLYHTTTGCCSNYKYLLRKVSDQITQYLPEEQYIINNFINNLNSAYTNYVRCYLIYNQLISIEDIINLHETDDTSQLNNYISDNKIIQNNDTQHHDIIQLLHITYCNIDQLLSVPLDTIHSIVQSPYIMHALHDDMLSLEDIIDSNPLPRKINIIDEWAQYDKLLDIRKVIRSDLVQDTDVTKAQDISKCFNIPANTIIDWGKEKILFIDTIVHKCSSIYIDREFINNLSLVYDNCSKKQQMTEDCLYYFTNKSLNLCIMWVKAAADKIKNSTLGVSHSDSDRSSDSNEYVQHNDPSNASFSVDAVDPIGLSLTPEHHDT